MKVSIAMITYNHEKFIAQAIEGVLMQETDFDYELIIGEDCSTDGTRDVVIDYHRRNPDKIRPLLHEQNIGYLPNFVQTLQASGGEYVALCEGDDYWTDPSKLQKQVDYLDAHPECAICFTKAGVFYDGSEEAGYVSYWPDGERDEITTFADLIVEGDYLPTCSTVYRNHLFPSFPEWFRTAPVGDWPLHLLNALHGNIYYMHEVMAAYRKHAGGVTAGMDEEARSLIRLEVVNLIGPSLGERCRSTLRAGLGSCYYSLALHREKAGDLRGARRYALRRISERHFVKGLENPIRQVIRLSVPVAHQVAKACKRRLKCMFHAG